MTKLPLIKVGYQVFATEGGEEFGAVRDVAPGGRPELIIYVENGGDFAIPLTAVRSVHDSKVVLHVDKLEPALRKAIRNAHVRETQ